MAWGEPAPRLARISSVETSGPVSCGPWARSPWIGPSCCKFSALDLISLSCTIECTGDLRNIPLLTNTVVVMFQSCCLILNSVRKVKSSDSELALTSMVVGLIAENVGV